MIASYIQPVEGQTVDDWELRRHLSSRLPAHMVPGAIVVVDRIPVTPVGKLDRKALPTPSFERRTVPYAPPTNNTERTVVDIFETVLGHETIGRSEERRVGKEGVRQGK